MRTHIKTVALVNILYSALGMLGACAVLLGGVFSALFSGGIGSFFAVAVGSVLAAAMLAALSLFGLIAGFGLLNHKGWARWVMIVVSAFRLLRWPFGTLFGAYSLWVLLNDETKRIFDAELP